MLFSYCTSVSIRQIDETFSTKHVPIKLKTNAPISRANIHP